MVRREEEKKKTFCCVGSTRNSKKEGTHTETQQDICSRDTHVILRWIRLLFDVKDL
jgi:hypothetical protein